MGQFIPSNGSPNDRVQYGPRPTGVAATDTANLQAAINATPSGGRLLLVSSATNYAINAALIIANHITIEGTSITTTVGETVGGVTPASPYLRGTVIKQTAAATDIFTITGVGKTVNLAKLGLLFQDGLASTGHGINVLPTGGSGKYGIFTSDWSQIYVSGHDGNHYGFVITNSILCTFSQCHTYFGGGWLFKSYGNFCGNSVLINPYVSLSKVGTAGCYDFSADVATYLNESTIIQPTAFISGAAGVAGTQYLWNDTVGASIPYLNCTISAALQSDGTNPLKQSTGTQFIAPAQSNVRNNTNTVLGVSALGDLTGQLNQTAFGYQALASATSGSQQNVAVGTSALTLNTTGIENTAIGYGTLASNVIGSGSTALGYNALAVSTVNQNSAFGYRALVSNSTGLANTGIGVEAGRDITTGTYNSIFGYTSGLGIVTGSGNSIFGNNAGTNSTDVNFATSFGSYANAVTNATAIGYNTQALATGSMAIGMDSSYASATTSTVDEIKFGTANHTANFAGKVGVGQAASGNGRLQVQAGTSSQNAKVGGVLFDHYADVNNTTTTETDLYTDTLAASTLAANGDKVTASYQIVCAGAVAATQDLRVYFGGTKIYDSGALSLGAITANFTLNVTCIRASSSIVRCYVSVSTDFATLFPYSAYVKVTGLTLTNTQIIKITGQAAGAGAASNQITGVAGYVEFKPGA